MSAWESYRTTANGVPVSWQATTRPCGVEDYYSQGLSTAIRGRSPVVKREERSWT